VGDVAIAMQMGHSDLKMIAKHYAHADHEIMRETARKAAGES
jgi:integrase